ncbi:MAG: PmoA family protein [Tannerella sp.]|nr:PmoA family protein [Tannerella sp.]
MKKASTLFGMMALGTALAGLSACKTDRKQADSGIEIIPDEAGKKVDILYNGRLFTSYIYPDDLEKPVLYPICTARGTVVTRGFPRDPRPNERVDHPHHVGLWFNFGDVNGLDFWNNSYAIPAERKAGYGSIRHSTVLHAQGGEKEGRLCVSAKWTDHSGNVLLLDATDYFFSGEGDRRIIDREALLMATDDTVVFTDNKEGLIAIRVDRAFEEPSEKPELFLDANGNETTVPVTNSEGVNGVYRNDGGLEKGDVWGKPARWVSLSAEKDGEAITIAIIDHPHNPGFPAYSHARGYGLFSTNNMGRQVFNPDAPKFVLTLLPKEYVTFRHRIVIQTNGFLTDADLNSLAEDFYSRYMIPNEE